MRLLFTIGLTVSSLTASAAEPAGRALAWTCPGQGYVPYAYPAFGSCPCGEDGCFHPRPYYACCGDSDPAYKQSFWRRWRRAHFRGGSMLDGVPCHCVFPPGRAVMMTAAPTPAVVPPQPAEAAQERDDAPAILMPEASSEPIPAGEPFPSGPEAIALDAEVGSP